MAVGSDQLSASATTKVCVSGGQIGVKIYEHTSTLLDTKYPTKNIHLFIYKVLDQSHLRKVVVICVSAGQNFD
jgi:hypothetical protein